MECKKCGAIIPEDGIFCVSCGARADGKKNCPKCEKLIDDTVTFCTYCGTRVDGKKVCATCGELVEGKFCAKCGSIVEEIAITKPSIKKSSSTKSGAVLSVIERIANPIIYIVALVLLLVCSFFIGTNVVTNVNETLITKSLLLVLEKTIVKPINRQKGAQRVPIKMEYMSVARQGGEYSVSMRKVIIFTSRGPGGGGGEILDFSCTLQKRSPQ